MGNDRSRRSRRQSRHRGTWIVGGIVLLTLGELGCGETLLNGKSVEKPDVRPVKTDSAEKPVVKPAKTNSAVKLNVRRAKQYLIDICKIGPRVSGSRGMAAQQKLLADHFTNHGAKVKTQLFDSAHPLTGRPVRFANLIVSWNPKATERILLACHYDTRPYPDRDRRNPRGRFIGANDGASGVALFMEMAHHMKVLKPTYGIDMVFFDGEEFVFSKDSPISRYFLGSKYFATQYVKRPPKHKYIFGIVVDMVGDRKLELKMERNSLKYAPDLTKSIWSTAKSLRIREFIFREGYEVQDDHIPLNQIAKIPTCDIIDFDYPHWHTTRDTPAQCSGGSLVKVARVLLTWLENVPRASKD